MESVTHALVGAGVAALSGEPLALANPIYLGAIIGAVAPDLDIIMYLKGDLPYLKHHRGFSHSLPGLALISLAISSALTLFYPETALTHLFFWTFLGAISHTLMDLLNSYGAKLLWPLKGKKLSLNLLMILDPVLIFLFGSLWFLPGDPQIKAKALWSLFGVYLIIRFWMRERLKNHLSRIFEVKNWENSFILPAIYGLGAWDFAIIKENSYLVGQINFFNGKFLIRERLPICEECNVIKKALRSKLGKIFQDFTPFFHVTSSQDEDRYIINFLDLRYYIRNDFLHRGTVVLDKQYNLIEGIFQPYSKDRKIKVI